MGIIIIKTSNGYHCSKSLVFSELHLESLEKQKCNSDYYNISDFVLGILVMLMILVTLMILVRLILSINIYII
jgi:hypothetical protein